MKQQRGETLIGLMIGMLIAMIAAVGMLTLFREVVQVSAVASKSAREDGERISALVTSHMLLQQAGFGMEDPEIVDVENLVWLEDQQTLQVWDSGDNGNGNGNGNGPCNGNGGGPQGTGNENSGGQGNDLPCDDGTHDPLNVSDRGIVWEWDPALDGNLECLGIVPGDRADLKLLRAPCEGASRWADVGNWQEIDLGGAVALDIQVNRNITCRPFGYADEGGVSVELTVEMSVQSSDGAPVEYTSTNCLANFPVGSP